MPGVRTMPEEAVCRVRATDEPDAVHHGGAVNGPQHGRGDVLPAQESVPVVLGKTIRRELETMTQRFEDIAGQDLIPMNSRHRGSSRRARRPREASAFLCALWSHQSHALELAPMTSLASTNELVKCWHLCGSLP